jgi:hypothetical protein
MPLQRGDDAQLGVGTRLSNRTAITRLILIGQCGLLGWPLRYYLFRIRDLIVRYVAPPAVAAREFRRHMQSNEKERKELP